MKKALCILLLLLTMNTFAQKKPDLTGFYPSSGGGHLFLDKDSTFFIVAYATFIQGTWSYDKNQLTLLPQNPKHFFEVYGRYNPNIKDGYKIKFNGFHEEETFMGTSDSGPMQRVFNKNPNCFASRYIHPFYNKSNAISFVDSISDAIRDYNQRNTYTFPIERNNDFIAVYNDPKRYYPKMTFNIKQTSKGIILESSDAPLKKEKMTEELKKEISELKEMGKKYKEVNFIYCNPSYNSFDEESPNIERDYSFDANKNAYVSKYNYEKDEELNPEQREDAYHRMGILYKYDKVQPSNIAVIPFTIIEKSLFTAKCAGDEE